jgi:hypothetical protein
MDQATIDQYEVRACVRCGAVIATSRWWGRPHHSAGWVGGREVGSIRDICECCPTPEERTEARKAFKEACDAHAKTYGPDVGIGPRWR